MSERAKAAAAYLAGVDADGLDPSEYPVPQIKAGMEPDALAEAEIKFTDSVLTFARHAMSGRVHYSRVSGDIVYDLAKPDPANVLARVAKAKDVGRGARQLQSAAAAVQGAEGQARRNPQGHERRREAGHPVRPGAEIRSKDKKGQGRSLMEDPRVPALRAVVQPEGRRRHQVRQGAVRHDRQVPEGAAASPANGQLTQATLDAINGPKREKTVDIILANMERWRWMPRDLGETYVMVNIPDYTLRVMHDGKQVWKTKVVVGQPGKPTPLLSAEMKFITVNPTWNVPPSIIQNEYLPALQQDPQALDRIGLKVEQNKDGTIRI